MFGKNLRWGMLGWLSILVLCSYFDRVNFSIAAPFLLKEYGLNSAQLGLVMSAFGVGYAAFNFMGGFMAERYTSRVVVFATCFLWSVMTIATGLAWSFASMIMIRLLFGASEGPMAPAITRIVNRWMLPNERATASGIWLGAMPVGVVIGNMMSAVIIDSFGWKSVFYIYGVAGFVIAVICWKFVRDNPEDHPSMTKEELNTIQTEIVKFDGSHTITAQGSTLLQLMKNPLVWIICLVYFSILIFIWANLNWLPTYFMKARGFNLLTGSFYASVPWIAAFLGPVVLGWLSDHTQSKYRVPWVTLSLFLIAPTISFAVWTPSTMVSLGCFTVASFFGFGALSLMWVVPMDIFAKADVGKISGIMLASGSLSAFVAPTLVGYVLLVTGSFNIAYYLFGAIALVGGFISFVLLSKERAIRREKLKPTVNAAS